MANIAKHLKRIRTEKGITQEAFSKMINVSRQAVSSWETGRTQPDIDMLGSISEALEVSIEELIYGERRNIKIDNEEKNYASTATIVLSILGGLLFLTGAVLILVWCWEQIPVFGKTVFALVPMAAGAAFSLYVLFKMKGDSFMNEIGATAWIIGNIVSVVFINLLFELNKDIIIILLISLVLTLPVMFIMKSVMALTALYGMAAYMSQAHWFFSSLEYEAVEISWVIFLFIGISFTAFFRKKLGFSRHRYAQWISLLETVLYIYTIFVLDGYMNPFVPLIAVFSLCYMLEKEEDMQSPLYIFGTLGSMITLLLCLYDSGDLVGGYVTEETVSIVASAVVFASGVYVNRENLKADPLKKWRVIIFGISAVVSAGYSVVYMFGEDIYVMTPMRSIYVAFATFALSVCTFAASVVFIVQGLKQNKLYPLNLGLISIGTLALLMFTRLDMDMLVKGCVLLIMGGFLIFMNLKITRNIEKEKKAVAVIEESTDAETKGTE